MKKGFTLIELLGVLVILGVLAVVTVPLVQSLITGAGDDSRKVQEEAFIKAAKTWAGNNAFSLPDYGEDKKLYLIDLICGGYLEANKKEGGEENDACNETKYYIKKSGSNATYDLDKDCIIISNMGTNNKDNKYEYKFFEDCQ